MDPGSAGITLKKSLGQHFLKDDTVCQKIVAVLKERPLRQLLEIGPGGGALTKHLLQIPDLLFKAVELDREKIAYLRARYPALRENLLEADFLQMERPFEGNFTVIGNFPYNISTQILFRMLEWKEQVEVMIGMFQKEVAQRAAAKEGSKVYGVLSVLIQAFYSVEYLFEVGEEAFTPPPKVKSAVIRLVPLAESTPFKTERQFFILVKMAFNQRRKKLRNAVRPLFDENTLAGPVFDLRAEQLSVQDFAALTWKMGGADAGMSANNK
jgi:16S rRNA (adenine1518-N6/adenine1519-N6)-dimethyltransferase